MFTNRSRAALPLILILASTALAQDALRPKVEAWTAANQKAIVGEFLDLLALPNVAADRPNIERNAAFLKAMLEKRGFKAELLPTDGNPLVWGERLIPGATTTVLVYCQFDGQPVNPRGWAQPDPFIPFLRTGRHDEGLERERQSHAATAPGNSAGEIRASQLR